MKSTSDMSDPEHRTLNAILADQSPEQSPITPSRSANEKENENENDNKLNVESSNKFNSNKRLLETHF